MSLGLWCVSSGGEYFLFNAIFFSDQGFFQDDSGLFVPLVFLQSKFVHPAQLVIALFAKDITDPMSTSQHDAFSWFTKNKYFN
jgi:hypothetical protein